jgi:Zn-dependent peptidase ImmA (M78 family)
LGHVLLHDHHAQQFSGEKSGIWKEEEDSEWQADTFSEELFVTEADVQNFVTPTNIANHCAVERDVVTRRLGKHLKYFGESCPSCGNFTLVRNGTCLKCDTCNWEVGM